MIAVKTILESPTDYIRQGFFYGIQSLIFILTILILNAMILICEYFSHKEIIMNDEDKKEKLFQTTERQN